MQFQCQWRGVTATAISLTLTGLASLMLPLGASAQANAAGAYPSKPIRIVISTAAGGTLDQLARLVGEKLTAKWGQPVIVESKAGANTTLATNEVAKSAPDGYTVLVTISGFVQNLVLNPNPPYKLTDLTPVSMIALFPIALAGSTEVPARTIGEMVQLGKQPNQLSFGSYGVGSSGHIIGEGLNKAAGVAFSHIPYKGEASLLPDLSSGRLAFAYGSVGFFARQVPTGKVRLIAVAGPRRLKSFPDVPTFAEAGFPGINLPGWGGMFLPAGTPPAIVDKLSAEVRRVVAMPEVQAKIYDMGYEPAGNSSSEFGQYLELEVEKWGKVVKENNIKQE